MKATLGLMLSDGIVNIVKKNKNFHFVCLCLSLRQMYGIEM